MWRGPWADLRNRSPSCRARHDEQAENGGIRKRQRAEARGVSVGFGREPRDPVEGNGFLPHELHPAAVLVPIPAIPPGGGIAVIDAMGFVTRTPDG